MSFVVSIFLLLSFLCGLLIFNPTKCKGKLNVFPEKKFPSVKKSWEGMNDLT